MIDFVFPVITMSHSVGCIHIAIPSFDFNYSTCQISFYKSKGKRCHFLLLCQCHWNEKRRLFILELNYNWVYRLGNLNKVEQSFVHLLSQLTHFFDLYAIFISSHQTCHLYVPYSHECLKWHTSLLLFISYFYDRNEIWIHNSFKTISMTR